MKAAAASFFRMTLNLQSLGAFPDPERPRTVWVGLAGPDHDRMIEFQTAIALAVAGVGSPAEGDRFTPHITLGRLKGGKGGDVDVIKQVAHFRTWSAGNFEATQVVAYASTLAPEGPTFMTLASHPLRSAKRRSDA